MSDYWINNLFGSWKNILIIIILIITVSFIILLLLGNKTINEIINNILDATPFIIPENFKIDLKNGINNKIDNIHKIPSEVTNEVIKYIPTNITYSITNGLPSSAISEDKCKRIIKDEKLTGIPQYPPENLPWDGKINWCENNNFDIEDIDLNNFIFSSNTKHKKVKTYLY